MGHPSRLRRASLLVSVLLITVSLACGGGSSSTPPTIVIDMANATSLFLVSSGDSSVALKTQTADLEALGFLRKLTEDGTIEPVLFESDGVTVAADITPLSIFEGPEGKIYIAFEGPGVVVNGNQCYLVRGLPEGSLECYGTSTGLGYGDQGGGTFPFSSYFSSQTPGSINLSQIPNRFDDVNNFYFIRFDGTDGNYTNSRFMKLSQDGNVVEILSYPYDEVSIDSFVIGTDGTIFFSGRTLATMTSFSRKTTAAGGVENIEHTIDMVASNGDLFSDVESGNSMFRGRFEDGSLTFDEIDLTSAVSSLTLAVPLPSLNLVTSGAFFEGDSGDVYTSFDGIIRVYPGQPLRVTPQENTTPLSRTSSNFLYYSGLDASNTNIFRRVDLTDETFPETDLLNGEDIEVYRFQVWSNGNILFGGLRLSDNQLILGEINGETLEMTVRTTTTTRIDELVLIE